MALQKSRREELEHVTRALSDPAATAGASTPAKATAGAASQTLSSGRVKKAGVAEPTVPPLADSPATPVTRPPAAAPTSNVTAGTSASPDQREDEAVTLREPSSLAESASAVQSEVDPKAAKFCCWSAGAVFSSAA